MRAGEHPCFSISSLSENGHKSLKSLLSDDSFVVMLYDANNVAAALVVSPLEVPRNDDDSAPSSNGIGISSSCIAVVSGEALRFDEGNCDHAVSPFFSKVSMGYVVIPFRKCVLGSYSSPSA